MSTDASDMVTISRADLDAMQAAVKAEVDDAVEWADQSPWPDLADLLKNVYENE